MKQKTRHKNTIIINGKTYDSHTGKILSTNTVPQNSIDGFIAPQNKKTLPTRPIQHATATKPQRTPTVRKPNHTSHRKPQKSQTLMRRAVKKPNSSALQNEVEQNHTNIHHYYDNTQRMKRAKSYKKSPVIQKFAHPTKAASVTLKPSFTKKSSSLSVKQPPGHTPKRVLKPAANKKSSPQKPIQKSTVSTAKTKPHTRSKTLLDNALSQAPTTQKQNTKHKRKAANKRTKHINTIAITTAVFLFIGFFGYQNYPNLNLRIASSQAGIEASLPSYQPTGFSFGPIEHRPGLVVLTYTSNSDDRKYTVSQRVSNWNTQALLDNYIAQDEDHEYQSVQHNGRTIYVHEGKKATWVNRGIHYSIESNAALSSDQLLSIATSF